MAALKSAMLGMVFLILLLTSSVVSLQGWGQESLLAMQAQFYYDY